MKLSVTLPSLFPELLQHALPALYRSVPAGVELEILVVSPFKVQGPGLVWIPESEARGNCFAHHMAYRQATGDYVLTLSDDFVVAPGSLQAALEHVVGGEDRNFPFSVGLHHQAGIAGTVFGIYYPYFPLMSRASIEAVGGYFSTDYAAHFGDVDLALRVWSAGGRCELSQDAAITGLVREGIIPESTHRSSARIRDLETFVRRWKPVFGAGWKTSDIRDFNLDIPSALFPALLKDRSIYVNHPDFRALILEVYDQVGYTDHKRW